MENTCDYIEDGIYFKIKERLINNVAENTELPAWNCLIHDIDNDIWNSIGRDIMVNIGLNIHNTITRISTSEKSQKGYWFTTMKYKPQAARH